MSSNLDYIINDLEKVNDHVNRMEKRFIKDSNCIIAIGSLLIASIIVNLYQFYSCS